jgi:hypothetical protein
VMLVASGPALGRGPCAVSSSRPFDEPSVLRLSAHRQSSSGKPRRRPVPSGGWFRSEELSRPVWRFRSWFTVCKPAFPGRRTVPNSLACLSSSGLFPPCRSEASIRLLRAAVNRPTVARLSPHLRFAGPIRRSTTRVFRYCCGHRCRIVRVKISTLFQD